MPTDHKASLGAISNVSFSQLRTNSDVKHVQKQRKLIQHQ